MGSVQRLEAMYMRNRASSPPPALYCSAQTLKPVRIYQRAIVFLRIVAPHLTHLDGSPTYFGPLTIATFGLTGTPCSVQALPTSRYRYHLPRALSLNHPGDRLRTPFLDSSGRTSLPLGEPLPAAFPQSKSSPSPFALKRPRPAASYRYGPRHTGVFSNAE